LIDKLCPLADLITPNIPEAERITGIDITVSDDIERAAEKMRSLGARNVLIKGGHRERPMNDEVRQARKAIDFLFIGENLTRFETAWIDTKSTHGTGCVLSAAIAANLALGRELTEAVRIAKDFVTEAIQTAPGLGYGHSPINI
jgi:hydroxymethylpyrimidine/phosphomethylpyrimidine kinase